MAILTIREAAGLLGCTIARVRRYIARGFLDEVRTDRGRTLVSEHQVFAVLETRYSGRPWGDSTRTLALDLLSSGTAVADDAHSRRLMARLSSIDTRELVGRLVLGHTALYSGTVRQARSLAVELGLTGRGVIAIATRDRDEATRRHHSLTRDPEGRVVVCEGDPHHQAVIEGAAFVAYGSSRELKAGLRFLAERQPSLGSQNN